MSLLKTTKQVFFVRSMEQSVSPCCGEKMKVIGSRRRKCMDSIGDTIVLVIRRLRCECCGRVHHELPDILVPYKRYVSGSIEAVVTNEKPMTVAADESTLRRWRNWFFGKVQHFAGCLTSIAIRYGRLSAEGESVLPQSMLTRIWHFVGNAPGWLARVVRPVVNTNNWIQTRLAFLS